MNTLSTTSTPKIYLIRRLLQSQGWVDVSSRGESMFPFIRENDVCRFVCLTQGGPKRGDVILFQSSSGRLVGHRFVKKVESAGRSLYAFKGDTNQFSDPLVPAEALIGQLILIQRGGNMVSMQSWFRRTWSIAALEYPILTTIFRRYIELCDRLQRLWNMKENRV